MSIKSISISDLEAQGPRGSVWVLNSAATSQYALVGEIVINIPKTNGAGADPLKIPQTWLPVDAAARFPRERLLDAAEFRSAVVNGLVTIVDEETAAKILRKDGATDELKRLRATDQHVRQAGAARTIADSNVEISRADGVKDDEDEGDKVEIYGSNDEDDNLARKAKNGVELNDGHKPSFLMFVDKLKTESDIGALNAIRSRAKFTRKEMRFMRDNLTRGEFPKTIKALKSRIAEFKTTA
jgi:hypothetical protein